MLAAEERAPLPSLFVVSDGRPVLRSDYYQYVAQLLGAPPPSFVAPAEGDSRALRAMSNRRIRNDRLVAQLPGDWAFPSYREGLANALR